MNDFDELKEEEKHIRTLSHYLEKYHNNTGHSNKKVAEILNIDRSYYNKIRLKQVSPLTNGIVTLKKFASLTDEDLTNFLYEIEEIQPDNKDKDNQWISILKSVFIETGPIIRRALIHKRLKNLLSKNDRKTQDKMTIIFTLTILLIDIADSKELLEAYYQLVLKFHDKLNIEKENDLKDLIQFVDIIKNRD